MAIPTEGHKFASVLLRYLPCSVGASRIDHNNLVESLQSIQATRKIAFLVLDGDDHRDR